MSDSPPSTSPAVPQSQPYRVLARKYRPQTFEALIGQEAMVRTLRNAIAAQRLAHAFIMTGVRGVGKTTTARLIARALNCVGEDGAGSETITPCGVCDFCVSIAKGTHPDVIEMDAASNTGVDDVRSIIDNVPYAATSARYKIYIIDEVHMLSRNAFNALLKTLEEPPEHVKFIFATTEIRKVPITVLSRCQRFDLKRIDNALLADHFKSICQQEAVEAEDEAIALIAQAAEGSVRDGLSLLDQAIAHAGAGVTASQVREMIGLADRSIVLDLAGAVFKGDATSALDLFAKQYQDGADPQVVMEELLDIVHWLTKCRLYPNLEQDPGISETQRTQGRDLSATLQIPALNTAWQILSKGLQEIRTAPRPVAAAEMVLVRLCYAATLPSPADLVKKWDGQSKSVPPAAGGAAPQGASPQGATPKAQSSQHSATTRPGTMQPSTAPMLNTAGQGVVAKAAEEPETQAEAKPHLRLVEAATEGQPIEEAVAALEDLVRLLESHNEGMLPYKLRNEVKVVLCNPSERQLRLAPVGVPDQELLKSLRSFLQTVREESWQIEFAPKGGDKTLATIEEERRAAQRGRALSDPAVKHALAIFPGAKVVEVRNLSKSDVPETSPLPKAPDGYDVLPDDAYIQDYDAGLDNGPHPFDPDFEDDL